MQLRATCGWGGGAGSYDCPLTTTRHLTPTHTGCKLTCHVVVSLSRWSVLALPQMSHELETDDVGDTSEVSAWMGEVRTELLRLRREAVVHTQQDSVESAEGACACACVCALAVPVVWLSRRNPDVRPPPFAGPSPTPLILPRQLRRPSSEHVGVPSLPLRRRQP